MPHHRKAAIPAALWIVLMGGSGCMDNAPAGPKDAGTVAATAPANVGQDQVLVYRQALPYYAPVELRVATGERDEHDRYPSAVEVYRMQFGVEIKPEEMVKLCSGVVVSPRLVLTSASCLCRRREAPSGIAGIS